MSLGPDGLTRKAPETFDKAKDAGRWLTLVEAQIIRKEWIDPDRGKVRLADYTERWIVERPGLRPRTVHLYGWLLRKHITTALGKVTIGDLTTPMIREWRSALLANEVSEGQASKSYRLLRAILNTAVKEDEMIRVNPCRIQGSSESRV